MKKLNLFLGLALLVAMAIVPAYLKNYGIHIFTTWLVFIIATMGLNLTVGYAGQKSLGHAAFFGIGAYTVAICLKTGISFWLALPAGGLLCFFTGLIVGFPALRVQTIYLAFATLGWSCATKSGSQEAPLASTTLQDPVWAASVLMAIWLTTAWSWSSPFCWH